MFTFIVNNMGMATTTAKAAPTQFHPVLFIISICLMVGAFYLLIRNNKVADYRRFVIACIGDESTAMLDYCRSELDRIHDMEDGAERTTAIINYQAYFDQLKITMDMWWAEFSRVSYIKMALSFKPLETFYDFTKLPRKVSNGTDTK